MEELLCLSAVSYSVLWRLFYGAGDGSRTRDPKLGKLVLYQLSYARFSWLL